MVIALILELSCTWIPALRVTAPQEQSQKPSRGLFLEVSTLHESPDVCRRREKHCRDRTSAGSVRSAGGEYRRWGTSCWDGRF